MPSLIGNTAFSWYDQIVYLMVGGAATVLTIVAVPQEILVHLLDGWLGPVMFLVAAYCIGFIVEEVNQVFATWAFRRPGIRLMAMAEKIGAFLHPHGESPRDTLTSANQKGELAARIFSRHIDLPALTELFSEQESEIQAKVASSDGELKRWSASTKLKVLVNQCDLDAPSRRIAAMGQFAESLGIVLVFIGFQYAVLAMCLDSLSLAIWAMLAFLAGPILWVLGVLRTIAAIDVSTDVMVAVATMSDGEVASLIRRDV